ncbi:glycoside hydrolase family protein [bacterium]|nr:glycoside hydrolase family protein [bacterium]
MSNILQAISQATSLGDLSFEQLKALQQALTQLGYQAEPDGLIGPETRGAWARFKSDNGMDQLELVGPSSISVLLSRLRPDSAGVEVPRPAVRIVKNFEGYRDDAYDDGVGVWTIGYGTTIYPDGQQVQPGDRVTRDQAENCLAYDLKDTAEALAGSIPYWASMNLNQQSALISIGFNLGKNFYGPIP